MGLYLHDETNGNNEVQNKSLVFNQLSSTGTDCVGFAERAASYKNNIYKWTDLPEGKIEGKDVDEQIREKIKSTIENGEIKNNEVDLAHFPQNDKASKIIFTRVEIRTVNNLNQGMNYFTQQVGEDNAPTENQLNSINDKFKTIIPGDIITYPGHIGVVADINIIKIDEAQSIQQIMDCIKIFESNYGASYNYVMERESTGGISKTINGNNYYVGSWFYDWASNNVLKLREFKFERLTIQE